jgi:hypothetical protein
MIQVSNCVFDHLRLVNRQPHEMKRYRRFLLGLQPGDVAQPVIEHEANGSCCRKEPWPATVAAIHTTLELRTLHLMAG